MDILNNLKVDGTITATGDITDGSSNKLSKKLDKLTTGPTAGTYTSVTINSEGQVTGGSNPTTLAGYGITDAVDIANAQTITGIKTLTEARTTTRTYNSANVNDIVTIGSLMSNPSVVHTTGNETVNGVKTFPSNIVRKTPIPTQSTTALSATGIQFLSTTDDLLSNLYIRRLADGKLTLIVDLLNSDGTTHSYITLATST